MFFRGGFAPSAMPLYGLPPESREGTWRLVKMNARRNNRGQTHVIFDVVGYVGPAK